jgi:hypothetical protein
MTLDEIAYNILNLLRGGRSNIDDHISLDQIKFNIKHYRAMFIRRDFARNGLVTRHLEQDLGCLRLVKVDASKCCNLPIYCPIYRTVMPIPKTVRFNFSEAITYTGDITGLGRIPLIEAYEVATLPYDKYTSNRPKAYMIEDYMYVYNPNGMEFINVRGIFEDPEELTAYDCGSNCYDSSTPFPLPADMVSAITTGMLSGELAILSQTFSDTTNDRQQDIAQVKE